MDLSDVKHLATLARLDIPEAEEQALLADLTAILGYVDQIKSADMPEGATVALGLHNVAREDIVTTVTGEHTDALLAAAPKSRDGYVEVRKIL